MNDEELYQVLYIDREGDERLTDSQPRTEAEKTIGRLTKDAYCVLSLMTVPGAAAYMQQKREAESSQMEGAKRFHQDELNEMAESVGSEPTVKADPLDRARVQTRHLALELALEMYGGRGDSRNAGEIVEDAETLLAFLEG